MAIRDLYDMGEIVVNFEDKNGKPVNEADYPLSAELLSVIPLGRDIFGMRKYKVQIASTTPTYG